MRSIKSDWGPAFAALFVPPRKNRFPRGAIGRVRLHFEGDGRYRAEEFAVASNLPKVSDLAFGPDGSLYVTHVGQSDYWYQPLDQPDGAIYRLFYAPWITPTPYAPSAGRPASASAEVLELGRQLFADRACSACHAIDGKTELLGPNLKDVGHAYSRDELLEEIREPSLRIKPSMAATRLALHDGTVLLGRVVTTDADVVRLMVVGNRIIDVPRSQVQDEQAVMESLMWPGLLQGLSEEEIDALLTYLASLQEANEPAP